LKSVNFWQSYPENNRVDVFFGGGTQVSSVTLGGFDRWMRGRLTCDTNCTEVTQQEQNCHQNAFSPLSADVLNFWHVRYINTVLLSESWVVSMNSSCRLANCSVSSKSCLNAHRPDVAPCRQIERRFIMSTREYSLVPLNVLEDDTLLYRAKTPLQNKPSRPMCYSVYGSGSGWTTWTASPNIYYKPFIGFWQPRKAGLNKHTEKSCIHNIHKITSLETI